LKKGKKRPMLRKKKLGRKRLPKSFPRNEKNRSLRGKTRNLRREKGVARKLKKKRKRGRKKMQEKEKKCYRPVMEGQFSKRSSNA